MTVNLYQHTTGMTLKGKSSAGGVSRASGEGAQAVTVYPSEPLSTQPRGDQFTPASNVLRERNQAISSKLTTS